MLGGGNYFVVAVNPRASQARNENKEGMFDEFKSTFPDSSKYRKNEIFPKKDPTHNLNLPYKWNDSGSKT
jgi:hypothetical protein